MSSRYTAPEDDSSSTEENKTDPSCDDSQDGGGCRAVAAGAKVKTTAKPRFAPDNDEAPLSSSSPEYGKKAQKSVKERLGGDNNSNSNACSSAKVNSCTSSEKSSDSGVSSSSSVCFGGNVVKRTAKRNGELLSNNKNGFGGHVVHNVKD